MFYSGEHYNYASLASSLLILCRLFNFRSKSCRTFARKKKSHVLLAWVCWQEFGGNTKIYLKSPCEKCNEWQLQWFSGRTDHLLCHRGYRASVIEHPLRGGMDLNFWKKNILVCHPPPHTQHRFENLPWKHNVSSTARETRRTCG